MLRDEILQATAALMREKGFAAISMDELATRVGISKPTLYSHFPTKDDLVVAVVMHSMDQVTAAVQADTTPRTPLQQLTFILRTVIQLQIDKGGLGPRPWAPEAFQFLCTHDEVIERLRRIDAAVVELVEAGQAGGEIEPALEASAVVRAFFALVNTLHSPFLLDLYVPGSPSIADTLSAIFERGVRRVGS
jgi:AcrR family transcriptional regulator